MLAQQSLSQSGPSGPIPDPPTELEALYAAVVSLVPRKFRRSFEKIKERTAITDREFSEEHQQLLGAFDRAWNLNDRIWFRKHLGKRVGYKLVYISELSRVSNGGVFICITGLTDMKDIKDFSDILSSRDARKHYHPLRICFERQRVASPSASEVSSAGIDAENLTLCGRLVKVGETRKKEQISTIGGVVEVDGVLYALTTAHTPDGENTNARSSPETATREGSLSKHDSSVEDDQDGCNELVIVHCDGDTAGTREDRPRRTPSQIANARRPTPLKLGPVSKTGSDWILVELKDRALWLPNAVPAGALRDESLSSVQDTQRVDPKYITTWDLKPQRKEVLVMAGRSGTGKGIMSPNSSYLRLGPGRSTPVWSVSLNAGFDLEAGDSGAWVVDPVSGSIAGHVVARTLGTAFILPFHKVVEEVKVQSPSADIGLPTPFTLLANISHLMAARPNSLSQSLAKTYALEALNEKVLALDPNKERNKLVTRALSVSEYREQLPRLLRVTGAEIMSSLQSELVWASFSDHRFLSFLCDAAGVEKPKTKAATSIEPHVLETAPSSSTQDDIKSSELKLPSINAELGLEQTGSDQEKRDPIQHSSQAEAEDNITILPQHVELPDFVTLCDTTFEGNTALSTLRPGKVREGFQLANPVEIGRESLPSHQVSFGGGYEPSENGSMHFSSAVEEALHNWTMAHPQSRLYSAEDCDGSTMIAESMSDGELRDALKHLDRNPALMEIAPTVRRQLGYFDVICLFLNRTIGAGIFVHPGIVLYCAGSPGAALLMWAFGCIIHLCGLLVWLEFGLTVPVRTAPWMPERFVSVPRNWAEKNLLQYLFHKAPSFLIISLYALPNIILGNLSGNAIAFAQFTMATAARPDQKGTIFGIAISALTLAVLLHIFSHRRGILINNIMAITKTALLTTFIILGFTIRNGPDGFTHPVKANLNPPGSFRGGTRSVWDYAKGFTYVLYCFSGFLQPFSVLTEVRRPREMLPKATLVAWAISTCLFILLNVVYLYWVPQEAIFGMFSGPDAQSPSKYTFSPMSLVFLDRIFGPGTAIRRFFASLIAVSIFGNILVMTYAAAGLKQEIAKEGILPYSRFLMRSWRTPYEWLREKFTQKLMSFHSEKDIWERAPIPALFLQWITSVFLIALVSGLSPTSAYLVLVDLYCYVLRILLPMLIAGGLLYLKTIKKKEWLTKAKFKASPLFALLYLLTLAFLAVAAFGRPESGSPASNISKLELPWIVVPAIGISSLLWGVGWFLGLKFIQWFKRVRLVVLRRPLIVRVGEDEWVEKAELIEVQWRLQERKQSSGEVEIEA